MDRGRVEAESPGNRVGCREECDAGEVAEPAGLVAGDQVWRWRMGSMSDAALSAISANARRTRRVCWKDYAVVALK